MHSKRSVSIKFARHYSGFGSLRLSSRNTQSRVTGPLSLDDDVDDYSKTQRHSCASQGESTITSMIKIPPAVLISSRQDLLYLIVFNDIRVSK